MRQTGLVLYGEMRRGFQTVGELRGPDGTFPVYVELMESFVDILGFVIIMDTVCEALSINGWIGPRFRVGTLATYPPRFWPEPKNISAITDHLRAF